MQVQGRANTVVLKIGEAFVSNQPVMLKCYGLGSCVALFLYDATQGNSAGAHIMLPGKSDDETSLRGTFSFEAVEHLIESLVKLGSKLHDLRAKLVGGANVANISSITIGEDNIASVKAELLRNNITIASMNVGGNLVRSAAFDSASKELKVTSLDPKNIFPQN